MDEEGLAAERLGGEIVRPGLALGWKWMLPIGAIGEAARLERPPFAPDQAHPGIIDRVAENRAGEGDLAGGQCAERVGQRRGRSMGVFAPLAALGAHR